MNSTEYYRENPDAAARKVAYQKKVNARPEEKKRRAELNKERRRRGIAGKGGPDVSHTTSGKTVLEDPHTNRGRQGAGGKPRLKKDNMREWIQHDGVYAHGFDSELTAGKVRSDKTTFLNKELHSRVKAAAKRKFKVYPSAYANAWMVREYKKRGGKFRTDSLDKWFKEKWVRMSSSGEILGPCGDRAKNEGKPRCLPLAKAKALSKSQRASTVRKKRREDPSKNRRGSARMVRNSFDGAYQLDGGPSLSVGRGEKLSVKEGGGLTAKGRAKYNRATGSNLQAPVTGKVKPGSKAAKRRKSFCARSRSWSSPRGKAARRRWRCDAAGKPCGASFIPKQNKCSKSVKSNSFMTGSAAQAAGIALTAGLLAGGAVAMNRKKPISLAEWRKSPKNPRNKPKLSKADADRIAKEAIAEGNILDMSRAGCGLKKLDSRTDAYLPAKAQCGSGAYGTYYVHSSREYGVKTFTGAAADQADPELEFDMLGKAHHAGVNTPEPLAMNTVTRTGDSDWSEDEQVQTLIMTHMAGYQTLAKAREYGNFPTIRVEDRYGDLVEAPRLIQLNFARELKKLHMAGIAHGDLHTGNIMYKQGGENKYKVGFIDMGYAQDMDLPRHPITERSPIETLKDDMIRMESMLGIDEELRPITHKGLIGVITDAAEDYSNRWETYELAIGRYYELVFRAINRNKSPRSKLLSSGDMEKIPGLNKAILKGNFSSSKLEFMNSLVHHGGLLDSQYFQRLKKRIGLKEEEVRQALLSIARR